MTSLANPVFTTFHVFVPTAQSWPEKVNWTRAHGLGALDVDLGTLEAHRDQAIEDFQSGQIEISSIIIVLNELNTNKETVDDVLPRVKLAMDLATEIGNPSIILVDYFWEETNVGVLSRPDRRALLKTLLQAALQVDVYKKANFLLEPIAEQHNATFPTVDSAADFIRDLGSSQVRILYDTYQLAWDHHDPLSVLKEHMELIGQIHLSDANPDHPDQPERPLPGSGQIDFAPIVELLMNHSEFRYWTFEGSPFTTQELTRSVQFIRSLMQKPSSQDQ